ncbi:MAG: hypothetical protein V8R51_03360 [Clostridia bacterium]
MKGKKEVLLGIGILVILILVIIAIKAVTKREKYQMKILQQYMLQQVEEKKTF